MLDGRNSHNLTLLLLGVKAREIRWKKYSGEKSIIIDNAWWKKFTQFNTITTRCKSKRNKMKEILGEKSIIIDNAWWKKFTQFNTITTRCKSKRNKMKEIQGKNQ